MMTRKAGEHRSDLGWQGGRYVEEGRLATRSLPGTHEAGTRPEIRNLNFNFFHKASKILEARRPLKSCGSARHLVCRPLAGQLSPPCLAAVASSPFGHCVCVCVLCCVGSTCSRRRPADSTIISKAS